MKTPTEELQYLGQMLHCTEPTNATRLYAIANRIAEIAEPQLICGSGQIVINSVIRANAIEDAKNNPDGTLTFVWSPVAADQIEGALAEAGYKLIPAPKNDQISNL